MSSTPGEIPPLSQQGGPPPTHIAGQQSSPSTQVPHTPGLPGYTASQAQTNNLAVVSFVAAIASFFAHIIPVVGGITVAVIAIVTGFMARGQIRRTGEQGMWMANLGIIIGFVMLISTVGFANPYRLRSVALSSTTLSESNGESVESRLETASWSAFKGFGAMICHLSASFLASVKPVAPGFEIVMPVTSAGFTSRIFGDVSAAEAALLAAGFRWLPVQRSRQCRKHNCCGE